MLSITPLSIGNFFIDRSTVREYSSQHIYLTNEMSRHQHICPEHARQDPSCQAVVSCSVYQSAYLSTFENFPGVESVWQLVSDILPIARGRYN